MKVHFREKYMKKKGIEEITAALEEEMAEAEEVFDYTNMNIRDGGESVWIMCNDPNERAKIRNYLIGKEVVLVIESDEKRFFGKFGSKEEKEKWKAANPLNRDFFGKEKPPKKEEL